MLLDAQKISDMLAQRGDTIPPAQINLAVVIFDDLQQAKPPNKALEVLSALINMKGGDVESARINRGDIYRELGQLKEAANDFDRAIEKAPKDGQAREGPGGQLLIFLAMQTRFNKEMSMCCRSWPKSASHGTSSVSFNGKTATMLEQ